MNKNRKQINKYFKHKFNFLIIRIVLVFLWITFLSPPAQAIESIDRDAHIGPGLHNGARTSNFYNGIIEPQYKLYSGYFHAHTVCSTGGVDVTGLGLGGATGNPCEAFLHAKLRKLDFLGLADHDWGIDVYTTCWSQITGQCVNLCTSDDFVALRGYEWSDGEYGHVSVMNTDSHLSSSFSGYSGLCEWLSGHQHAIAIWNHPEKDFHRKFRLTEHGYLPQFVAMELFSGNDNIEKFYNNDGYHQDGYGLSYLDEALQLGWLVGVVGGQDTHNSKWGDRNCLVGVWAPALSRKDILDAYASQRTYATEFHKRLGISFTIDGYQMGAKMTPRKAKGKIRVWDRQFHKYPTFHKIEVLSGYARPWLPEPWNPLVKKSFARKELRVEDKYFVAEFDIREEEILIPPIDFNTRIYWYVVVYSGRSDNPQDIVAISSPIWMFWKHPDDGNEPDYDKDGVIDACDNCPFDPNPDQMDSDKDSVGDTCDNCSSVYNPGQENEDHDDFGDECET